MNAVESFKTKFESFLIGCDAVEELNLWDKSKHGEMDSFYTNDLIGIVLRFISIDGRVSQSEVDFFNDTLGFHTTIDEITNIYETCKDALVDASFDESFENGISLMRKINSQLADAYKEILIEMLHVIMGLDGIETVVERCEIERLEAMLS